jgi:hypothetical protein
MACPVGRAWNGVRNDERAQGQSFEEKEKDGKQEIYRMAVLAMRPKACWGGLVVGGGRG